MLAAADPSRFVELGAAVLISLPVLVVFGRSREGER